MSFLSAADAAELAFAAGSGDSHSLGFTEVVSVDVFAGHGDMLPES